MTQRMLTAVNMMAVALAASSAAAGAAPEVATRSGVVRGTATADGRVRVFKGIPYAATTAGEFRWKEPRPAAPWKGAREAAQYGPQCMQGPIFPDITFPGPPSEDCLSVNLWTPAKGASERLPVMVWIHGGGFQAGAGGEPRHDGEALARKGVVVVTLNYRLGVFGFFAHPELTRESEHHASGNYGLLDQVAALRWVKDNAAAFGGDPSNVTIFGESAGSLSVSALMVSPLARGLFHKAIGESGAYFTGAGPLPLQPLPASEEQGVKLAASVKAESLAALRAKPADELLQAALKAQPWFAPNLDGRVLSEDGFTAFGAGRQAHVPLLAGWNADEVRASIVLRQPRPTAQSFTDDARKRFGDQAEAILKAYPAGSDAEALESAAALAGDMFIGHATGKWIDTHARTGGAAVFRFSFDRKIPLAPDTKVMGVLATARDVGARHAGEIEYVFGALDSLPKVPWEASDRKLSDAIGTYWTSFARTGDPNGPGVPAWPRYDPAAPRVLHLDEAIHDAPDTTRARFEAIDALVAAQRAR